MGSEPARTTPAERQRAALLALARSLAQTRDGGVLSDALEPILTGLAARHGLVFRLSEAGMEVVADRGAEPKLRQALARIATQPPWSVMHAATSARAPVVGRAFATSLLDRLGLDAEALEGWGVAAASPVIAGRRVVAVVLVGAETETAFDPIALSFLETACNVLGVALAREQPPRRESERLLRDAQITALGILAASLVEDLRAPLAAIALGLKEQDRLVAELKALEAGSREVAQLAELTVEAHAAVRRARDVTARLVAAVEQTPYVPVDVASIARDALDVVRRSFDERGVALDASIDKGCEVRGRPDELTQLVVAMLDNAIDAAERASIDGAPRGRVRLTVRDETVRVVVSVEDSGAGVAADLRGKIFDPFFSTKTGRIGVGLTLCRQTVLAHKGHLELARSADLGGASFRIVLPSSQHRAAKVRSSPMTTPPMGLPAAGRPRVVWIDDEELFLSSMRRGLPEWDMSTAKTGAEGERLVLEACPMVVFCDVGLPDRSGHEVHQAVAAKDPDLARRFVFVTGGVITPEIADYLIASGCLTLLKPVHLEEIRALVDGRMVDPAPLSARTLREQPSVPPSNKRRTSPPDAK